MSLDSILRATGKNLFDINSAELVNAELDGNGIKFTGSAGGSIDIKIPAARYTLSFKRSADGAVFLRNGKVTSGIITQIDNTATSVTFTFTGTVDGYLRISTFVQNLVLSDIQIEKGSTATAYEPYQQGPKSIKIPYRGNNIITYPYENTTQTINGVTFTVGKDGGITISGNPTDTTKFDVKNSITLEQNKQYTLSGFKERVDNIVFYPQLEEGTVATEFSLNTGDKEVLKVSYGSRNLWQNTNTTFPAALSYNSTNQTYILGAGTAGYLFVAHTLTNPIPAGITVTISVIFQSGKGRGVAIGGYHRTGGRSWQGHINVPFNVDMTGQTLTSTFTTTETVEEFMVFHNTGDNIEEPFVFQVQYELGDKATEYVPYSKEVVWTK